MGGGVSKAPYESIEAALADGKTQEEIDAWQAANNNTKDDNNNAENDTVESNNNGEENGGDGGGPDWMAMFAHKGDYEAQKESLDLHLIVQTQRKDGIGMDKMVNRDQS